MLFSPFIIFSVHIEYKQDNKKTLSVVKEVIAVNEIFIIIAAVILLYIGIRLTGFFLRAVLWMTVEIPLSIISFVLGLICCCTLILIPVGIWFFRISFRLLIPGV